MSVLKVEGLKFNYYDKELYDDLSFTLNFGEHAVLVGQNGCGKTTLFDLITGQLIPDKGKIEIQPHIEYSYLDQKYKIYDNFSIKELLQNSYKDLFELEKKMNDLYALGSDPSNKDFEKLFERANSINDTLINEGFYDIETKIHKIVVGLGISQDRLDDKLSVLSSGQKEKVFLAKMLLDDKDLLLLDEPTNYLDAVHVEWLGEYLKSYKKTFIVISHDEKFLKEIANVVFHLTNKKIERYKGNYDYFLKESEIRKAQYEKDYNAQQRYIKKEEEFIAAHLVRATSSRQAKSRRTRLSHLERMDAPNDDTNKVYFNFPYKGDIGKEILKVNGLVIGYGKPLLKPISFELRAHDKIAIIGKNGVGKSTLVKTLLNLLPSLGGEFIFNPKKDIGYFSQTESDDFSITPVQFIERYYPQMPVKDIRSLLARSGIKANLALKPFNELSGGEEAKARLSLLTLKKTNILVLDEPTNHLDKVAKESLKKAILDYEGVVILVSHEKDFYESIVDYIIKLD